VKLKLEEVLTFDRNVVTVELFFEVDEVVELILLVEIEIGLIVAEELLEMFDFPSVVVNGAEMVMLDSTGNNLVLTLDVELPKEFEFKVVKAVLGCDVVVTVPLFKVLPGINVLAFVVVVGNVVEKLKRDVVAVVPDVVGKSLVVLFLVGVNAPEIVTDISDDLPVVPIAVLTGVVTTTDIVVVVLEGVVDGVVVCVTDSPPDSAGFFMKSKSPSLASLYHGY